MQNITRFQIDIRKPHQLFVIVTDLLFERSKWKFVVIYLKSEKNTFFNKCSLFGLAGRGLCVIKPISNNDTMEWITFEDRG